MVGTCAELIQDVYVHGEVKRSAYLCGLKKDPAYQGLIPYVRSLEDYSGHNIVFLFLFLINLYPNYSQIEVRLF